MNVAKENFFKHPQDAAFVKLEGIGLISRDLELGTLSGGRVAGQVFRADPDRQGPLPAIWHMHELEFQIGYIVRGWGLYEFEGVGEIRLEAGAAIYHVPRNRLRMLDCSDDFEGVWIKSSNQDKVTLFVEDEASETLVPAKFVQELK